MEIKNLTEEIANKFGNEIDKIGYHSRGNRAEATIIYVSGIPNFDEALEPCKFEETNCLIEINSSENCVIFLLLLPNAKTISNYLIWRKDLISFEYTEEKVINIPNFELLKSITPLGLGTGVVGQAMAEIRFNRFLKNKDFKIVGNKPGKGIGLNLKYFDEVSSNVKEIQLNIPDKFTVLADEFFPKQWKSQLTTEDKKSSKCYIASACYQSPIAPEVLFLKSYRDTILSKNYLGRMFIKFYYLISPTLVHYFYNNKFVKRISKSILNQLIQFLKRNYNLQSK